MKYLFLIKAGKNYGLGHYARSKSLASFLKGAGHEIIFWVEGDSIDLQNKFNVVEKNIARAPSFFRKFVTENNIDVLYVDGNFEFDKELFNSLKSKLSIVFYQNLSASKANCDVFINPYPHDSRLNSVRKSSGIKLYEGFKFYIIRDEVRELNRDFALKKGIDRVTITTGGSDPNFVMERICDKINFERYPNLSFSALVGSSFESERIRKMQASYKHPNLNFNPFSLEEIEKADFIISTLGVSVFELLYLGKLVACISINQDSKEISQYLGRENLAINLGFYKSIDEDRINELLDQLTIDTESFIDMAKKAKKIIDGNGLERVSKILETI